VAFAPPLVRDRVLAGDGRGVVGVTRRIRGPENETSRAATPYLLAGIVLFWTLTQVQMTMATGVMEETWTRNLLNILTTSVTPAEYITGVAVFGMVKLALALATLTAMTVSLYGFDLTAIGWSVIPIVILLVSERLGGGIPRDRAHPAVRSECRDPHLGHQLRGAGHLRRILPRRSTPPVSCNPSPTRCRPPTPSVRPGTASTAAGSHGTGLCSRPWVRLCSWPAASHLPPTCCGCSGREGSSRAIRDDRQQVNEFTSQQAAGNDLSTC
jgi:hypothetical protein